MSEFDTTSRNEVPFMAVARDDLDFVATLNDISINGFVNIKTIHEREDGSMFFSGWIVREGSVEVCLGDSNPDIEK